MTTTDVIVAGVGGVGSSTLCHLASQGVRAIGIDRFAPGHDRGSSHGDTRLIRQAYFEHPDYVPLLKRAYSLWRDLEEACGQRLYFESGLLQAGLAHGRVIPGVMASARQHGLSVEPLSADDVPRRFPGFRIPASYSAVFESRAGFLRVEDCVRAYANQAVSRGAELRVGETVQSFQVSPAGVCVITDRETYSARALVVSPGAWAVNLLGNLGVPFKVVRKSLYWFATEAPVYELDRGSPGFLFETPEGEFYGFPQIDSLGVKAAEHTGGHPVADPLQVDRTEDPRETERLRGFLEEYLPFVSSRQTRFATCLYTLSPDQHFVLDRHPESPQVAFAAGLSGHGFKFVSVLGEVLADWVTAGRTDLPVGFLSMSRESLRCGA